MYCTDKPFFKKKYDTERKKPFNNNEAEKPKRSFKKSYSDKPKSTVNSNDLDESDFEYGKSKPVFDKGKQGAFTRKPYNKNKFSSKKGKQSNPEREIDDGMIRLNRFISNAGICSRREADDLISSGVVQVNGKVITEMGFRVKPTDIIKYGGQTLRKERMVYLILNKPKDYITSLDDPQKRRTVLELISGACKERIYPVGRLDRATTGLLMFTNDGDLTKKLTHPKYGVRKISARSRTIFAGCFPPRWTPPWSEPVGRSTLLRSVPRGRSRSPPRRAAAEATMRSKRCR